jgi:hypothetical protein
MEKRRVVAVAMHSGGMEEKLQIMKNSFPSLISSNLGQKPLSNLHILYKWYNLGKFIS